ncbi:hypothetical protein LTR37_011689 [Vermiconidia calcicola]|uniref:Uncharacterized protein n=1 Tax=Vermiconidia calcicola TaxID=1690605 RepID=A0ACC3N2Y0_9PEZI|nr:hypothetical protein LTR37_011689 [Vermiconidia calcicola]
MPAEADLATTASKHNRDGRMEDPFASPTSSRSSRAAVGSPGTDTNHDRIPHHVADSRKPASVSSAADSTVMTPMSSIDLEKAPLGKKHAPKPSSRESRRSGGGRGSKSHIDPEKATHHNRNDSHHAAYYGGNNAVAYMEDDEEDIDEGQPICEKKAVKVLFFLAGPCVILSSINCAWAMIALVITALAQPIRLCARRPSFGQQLAGLLGPTLNLQLRCIYTPLPPHADEDGSYHTFMLVLVHILSPFLSFVVMFASWVLAVYWVSSTMVGDPAGQDKRDDGKETVLGLRRWWERWLLRGVKED